LDVGYITVKQQVVEYDDSTDIDEPVIEQKECAAIINEDRVSDLPCKEECVVNEPKVEDIGCVSFEELKLKPGKRRSLAKVKRGNVGGKEVSAKKKCSSEADKEVSVKQVISTDVQPTFTENIVEAPTTTVVEQLECVKSTKTKQMSAARVKKERLTIRGRKTKRPQLVPVTSESCVYNVDLSKVHISRTNKKSIVRSGVVKSDPTNVNDSAVAENSSVRLDDVPYRKPKIESKELSIYEFCEEEDHNVEQLKPIRRSVPMTTAGKSSVPITTTGKSSVPITTAGKSLIPMTTAGKSSVPMTTTMKSSVPMSTAGKSSVPMNTAGKKEVTLQSSSRDAVSIEEVRQPPVSLKTYLKPRHVDSKPESKLELTGSGHKPVASVSSDTDTISSKPFPKDRKRRAAKRKSDNADVLNRNETGRSSAKKICSSKKFNVDSTQSFTGKRRSNVSTSETDEDEMVAEKIVSPKKKQSKKVDIDAVGCTVTKSLKKRRKVGIENVNIICEGTVRMTMIEAQIKITEMSRDSGRRNSRKNFKKSKISDVVATFPQIEFTTKTDRYKKGKISQIKIKDCRKDSSASKSSGKKGGSFEFVDLSCVATQKKSSSSKPRLRLAKSRKIEKKKKEENIEVNLDEPCAELSIVEAVSRIAKKRSEQLLKPPVFDEASSESSEGDERTETRTCMKNEEEVVKSIQALSSSEDVVRSVENTVNSIETDGEKMDAKQLKTDESMIVAEDVITADIPDSVMQTTDTGAVQSEMRSDEFEPMNTVAEDDYDKRGRGVRPLSPVDLSPMEDISPRNFEDLSLPSTGSQCSSERDDDIPMTPPPLRREASNASRDSLDSKELSMPRGYESERVIHSEDDEVSPGLHSYQAVPVITTQQSQLRGDQMEGNDTSTAHVQSPRDYENKQQHVDRGGEFIDDTGRYEASVDTYSENQVMYRPRSPSPRHPHQQERPGVDTYSENQVMYRPRSPSPSHPHQQEQPGVDTYSENQVMYRQRSPSPRHPHHQERPGHSASKDGSIFVYSDAIPPSEYVERQYTHRAERHPLQSLEGLASGAATGSPGGPGGGGGYFDQELHQQERGGKQDVYLNHQQRSSYGMTSPGAGYSTELAIPPSVGQTGPPSASHTNTPLGHSAAHSHQAPPTGPTTGHVAPPSGHVAPPLYDTPPTGQAAPITDHVAPAPPGHHLDYGRVSDPRFIIQRSPPDNTAHSRPVSHAAVPGFPSDSFAKDFFGQYFQDPGSHLAALGGAPGQDQRSLGGYMSQQLPGGFSRAQADLFRCTPSALISNSPYPSIPESFLGMKPPPPGVVSQSAQGQHWSAVGEERSRPWSSQTSSMLEMEPGSRNPYSKLDYASDTMSISSQSSKRSLPGGSGPPSDLVMFPGASASSLPPPPTAQSTDKYGMPNSAYPSLAHAYSPTGAASVGSGYSSRGLAGPSSASQKQLEDAYRHAAAAQLNDYRTLAAAQAQHAQMPPDVYMAGINPGSLAGFDRYYYATARDAMYRSHHLAASAMPHHFMQQGSASQQVYGDRGASGSVGYGREGMYGQPSPYSFMGGAGNGGSSSSEKQYLSGGSSAKGPASHSGPPVAHSDYLQNSAVQDSQDPYRRSVIYNMMTPRYF